MKFNFDKQYDWEQVYEAMRPAVLNFFTKRKAVRAHAESRELSLSQYVAGKVLRAAQEVIDYTLEDEHPWPSLFHVLRSHIEYFEANPELIRAEAKAAGLSRIDHATGRLFHMLGMAIDFHSYMEYNTNGKRGEECGLTEVETS